MRTKFIKKSKLAIFGVVAALGISVLSATVANADDSWVSYNGSCATPTAFIKSTTSGSGAHYRNNVLLQSWNSGILSTTKQSDMAPTWSSAKVAVFDGGTSPKGIIHSAYTGCGRL